MQKLSKEKIIKTYNELVSQKEGKLIGEGVFMRETGISHHYWKGGYWRSWSSFQKEAGHTANSPTQKIPDELILHRFAELTLERNSIPSEADLMLKRKEDTSFPSKYVYRLSAVVIHC
jgi:hypothetical protein